MPKKPKVASEEKVSIVRRCLSGELGICEAGRMAGVNWKTIRRWITRYETEGAEGFLPWEQNRVYSAELKKTAVAEYLRGGGKSAGNLRKTQNTRRLRSSAVDKGI